MVICYERGDLVVLPAISVHGIILDGLSGRYETKIDWELFQLARKYEAGEELSGKVTGIQPYGHSLRSMKRRNVLSTSLKLRTAS